MLKHHLLTRSLLGAALLFGVGQTRADELDFVLDVMYKAGVIDGNVVAAKPLIFCLADGNSVEGCTLNAANDSEFAEDPQVRNALDIYMAFRAKDYATVLKKGGVTIGCALIPGGNVKDVVCGELGQMALSVINGLGGALSDIGCAVSSLWGGCEDDEPPPMSAKDYYTLFYLPASHRLLMAKDAEDGSYEKLLNALFSQCHGYYDSFEETATNACEANHSRANNKIPLLYKALRDEGGSQYALRVEPKLESWAFTHFGQDSSAFVAESVTQCRADVTKAAPLPNAMARCEWMSAQYQALASSSLTAGLFQKLIAQCQAEQQPFVVNAPNDIYAVACEPVAKKTPSAAIGAMAVWKKRMDKAAAAGCSNNGTPASISCPNFDSLLNCLKAIPEKRSVCEQDATRKQNLLAQGVLEQLYNPSAKAGKPQRCVRLEDVVQCNRPVKQQQCETFFALYGDFFKSGGNAPKIGMPKNRCPLQADPAYDEQVRHAKDAVAILNGGSPASITRSDSVTAPSRVQASALWKMAEALSRPAGSCRVEAPDWLRIRCDYGFVWNADATRAQAVQNILGGDLALCPNDMEGDGADLPCLDGVPVAAFPSAAEPTPEPEPASRTEPVQLKLDPSIYRKLRPVPAPTEAEPDTKP